jgi:hypothetical protein
MANAVDLRIFDRRFGRHAGDIGVPESDQFYGGLQMRLRDGKRYGTGSVSDLRSIDQKAF